MEAMNLSSIPETTAVSQVGDRHARDNQSEQEKKKKKKRKTSNLLNPSDKVILSSDANVSIDCQTTNPNEASQSSDGPEHHIDIAA